MNDPTDYDGLLSSLKPTRSATSPTEDEEVDLSVLERLSDLTN
jgi:hypothetical protein